jgi:hypothetical protein
MPVRNQNWYDLQAGRRYPLDDRTSGTDDAGNLINDSILLDCHIRFPETLGTDAFVQAITVSPTLVSVLIGAAADTVITTIAAISLPKPITTNKNYAITPLVGGVAGWVVFGAGVGEPFAARYSRPEQSRILPRCARPYTPLPIQTIGKINLSSALSGVVNIEVVAPIVVAQKTLTINSQPANVLEFSLAQTFDSTADNPLSYFLSPCGQRPESGTCPKQPIETINDITPDCDGNINIITDGMGLYQFENCGGLGIDLPIGLVDACNKPRYEQPRQPADLCEISSSSSAYVASSSSSSSSSSHTPILDPLVPPFFDTFSGSLAELLTVRRGRFISKTAPAPDVSQQ